MGKNKPNDQIEPAESKFLAQPLTLEQQVEQAKRERVQHCGEELNALLKKYNCQIMPVVTIEGGQIQQALKLIPL